MTDIIILSSLGILALSNIKNANALPWDLVSVTTTGLDITGSFFVDDENANPVNISLASILIDGTPTFTQADITAITNPAGVGSGINLVTFGNTSGTLSLAFNSPFLQNTASPGSSVDIGASSIYLQLNPLPPTVFNINTTSENPSVKVSETVTTAESSTTSGLIFLGVISGAKCLYDKKKNKKLDKT